MYSALGNQVINLTRFTFAFLILFVLWPRVLFRDGEGIGLDGFMSRYVKMVCVIIVVGYFLVFTKLYELISLIAALLILSVYNRYLSSGGLNSLRELEAKVNLWFYDFLEGKISLEQKLVALARQKILSLQRVLYSRFSSVASVGNTLLVAAVLIYAAYLRFYDSIVHAAPAMSDAYVTLAWMKYIEKRIIFHDGIYPQGFHIYLSALHKFAANDPLYVLKYTGPLNGFLTTLGMYFVVSRLTGRRVPGIISALIYGMFIDKLHMYWARQVAANSQEFALVFLLPGWYYAHMYLKSQQKNHFWAAAACFTVIGLVHAVVFVFLGIGLFCLLAAYLVFNFRESLKRAWKICLAGGAAGIVAGIPALLGLLLGRHFHGASVDFLTLAMKVSFPPIDFLDQAALASIVLFFLTCILIKKARKNLIVAVFILLLGLSSFAMYAALGPITGKAVLVSRMGLLWGLIVPIGIGVGWSALVQFIPDKESKKAVEMALAVAAVCFTVVYWRPVPAEPYKMQYDSMVEQYLRISDNFRPTEWMIVSAEEGYALALGRGYHLMLGDFLSWYDPTDQRLAREVNGWKDVLLTPDTFIFKEKNVFRVQEKSIETITEPIWQRRINEYRMLDEWLEKYKAAHNNLSIYYEDPDIQIIRIHEPKSREKVFREIWGN